MAMIPHERSLVEKYSDEPFAIIGVNSDSPEAYERGLKEHPVTWRSFMAGSTTSEIPTKWNVSGWPTIYVLDVNGVIRYKNVRGEELDKAIDALIQETKAEPSSE